MRIDLRMGDCFEKMKEIPSGSIQACVVDPPYGLEFMGKDWDKLWESGASMTKPGIGDRNIPWPSFGGLTSFGGTNPTCASCGGRLRGAKTCICENPDWRVKGEKVVDPLTGSGVSMAAQQAQGMQAWHRGWLAEVHRVLQPGGVVKSFSATRTFHRLAGAMEEAGFTELDLEAWGYGSGMAKSHNVAVYMDKILRYGKSREVRRKGVGNLNGKFADATKGFVSQSKGHEVESTQAILWIGWGTALKPAWEPFVVGKKP